MLKRWRDIKRLCRSKTAALRAWLRGTDQELVACDLVRTELMKAVRRVVRDRGLKAREVLDSVTLVELRSNVFEEAGGLDPSGLQSLDAIHLAAALDLGDDLAGLVTYGDRLAKAAIENGVPIVTPR